MHLVVRPDPKSTPDPAPRVPRRGSIPVVDRGASKATLRIDYAANPRVVEEAEMHILEAALAANLRLSPRNRAVANTGVWDGRAHPIGRLAAAAAAIGLFVLALNGASTNASPREAASAAETKVP